jgi:ketosteroid isomerase-like protein
MKKTLMFLLAVVILIGCSRTPVIDIRTETEVIRNIEDQWTAAIVVKDIDKIMGILDRDAVIMNANVPACTGLQAIRASQESWFSDTTILHETFKSAVDTIEVSASGDLAYVRGNSRVSIRTSAGIVEETDKWITIYKKINGEWKAIVDIWNSDQPLIKE